VKFPVEICLQAHTRKGCVTLTLLAKLLEALELGPGKPVTAVVSPGVVILCRPEWAPVFECILRDFPRAFVQAEPREIAARGVNE
jgi:hypothetical protein